MNTYHHPKFRFHKQVCIEYLYFLSQLLTYTLLTHVYYIHFRSFILIYISKNKSNFYFCGYKYFSMTSSDDWIRLGQDFLLLSSRKVFHI